MRQYLRKKELGFLLTMTLLLGLLSGTGMVRTARLSGQTNRIRTATVSDATDSDSLEDGKVEEAVPDSAENGGLADEKGAGVSDGNQSDCFEISWLKDNQRFSFLLASAGDAYYCITTDKMDENAGDFTGQLASAGKRYEKDETVAAATANGQQLVKGTDTFYIYAWLASGNPVTVKENTIARWDYTPGTPSISISWPDEKSFMLTAENSREFISYCIADYSMEELKYAAVKDLTKISYGGTVSLPAGKNVKPFSVCAWFGNLEESSRLFTFSYPVTMPAVTASVSAGTVNAGTEIHLYEKRADAEIRYTLDGSMPDRTSLLYSEAAPVRIERDTVICARAFFQDTSRTLETGWRSGNFSAFQYHVGTGAADQYETNDTPEDATVTAFPSRLEALISTEKDIDYYRFTVGNDHAGTTVNLILSLPYGKRYGLSVLDQTGKVLGTSTLDGTQTLTVENCAAGSVYYAKVFSIGGACSETDRYAIRIYPSEKATDSNLKTDPDFSEMNMVTSLYGNETGAQTPFTGAGGNRRVSSESGGDPFWAATYYSEWYGPVYETEHPYDRSTASDSKPFLDLSGNVKYHMQNAIFAPVILDTDRDSYMASLKNMIYSYGAVTISMGVDNKAFSADSKHYYEAFPHDISGGHQILAVGWDDSKDKQLFTNQYGETPAEDGALLIKNSWGSDWGEDGFFWISYEDAALAEVSPDNPTVFLMEEAADSYSRQYLNDANGFRGVSKDAVAVQGAARMSNQFTTDENAQLLKAVSLVTAGEGIHYMISLKVGEGSEQMILSGSEKYAGYYTKRLSEAILLPANTNFTLTETLFDGNGGRIRVPFGGGGSAEGLAYAYDSESGTTEDLSSHGLYPCLRAFTVIPNDTGKAKIICRTPLNGKYGTGGKTNRPARTYAFSGAASVPEKGSLSYTATAVDISDLPSSYDLRTQGVLTTVKNQNPYGSCWTFATTASVESNVLLNGGDGKVRFSYPRTLDLTSAKTDFILTKDNPAETAGARAVMDTNTPSSRVILWTFSGDIDEDHITILNTSSLAGEDTELFTFKKAGTVFVTAICDADITLNKTLKFTATEEGITKITLPEETCSVAVGGSYQISPVVEPAGYASDVLYESSDQTVAYVDKNSGLITALKAGTAVITVRGGTAEASLKVTVYRTDGGNGSGGGGSSSSGNRTGGSAGKTAFLPDNYNGTTQVLNGFTVPSYVEKGSWTQNADGSWSCKNEKDEDIRNVWAAIYNPYANTSAGESPYSWFKFDEKGNMQTGWYTDSKGDTYYLNPASNGTRGAMQTGWVMIDGKWYYFDKTAANEGKLLRNGQTPEGYHVLADGSWDGKPKS